MAKKSKAVVEVEMPSGTVKGEGETIEEAMLNVPLNFLKVKYKGTVKVSKDGKSANKFFPILALRKIFATRISKIHWAHQIEKFLK